MSPPNIVVSITEKLSEDVDGHDSQSTLGLDLQYRQHSLVQNGVADILRRLGIRRNLDSPRQPSAG